jgi:hypothetical protein
MGVLIDKDKLKDYRKHLAESKKKKLIKKEDKK